MFLATSSANETGKQNWSAANELVGSKLAVIVFNAKLWESSTFMCKFQAAVGWKGPSKRRGYYDERVDASLWAP